MFSTRKKSDTYREHWGYSFHLTDQHLSREEIDSLRSSYDTLGATVLERLQAIASRIKPSQGSKGKPDLYAILRDHHQEDEVLTQFWDEVQFVPEWVDWKQLERGQKVFARYLVAYSTAFAFQGFIRENATSIGAAEVTARTGGLTMKNLLPRLTETAVWLIQITNSLDSIKPRGDGHTSTIRVRLLHASVRQRILKLAESRPSYYSVARQGVPINSFDSVHAISLFACNPLWDSFPRMGVYVTKPEIEDFLALFRYVAHVIGAPTKYFETPEKAKAVMETMFLFDSKVTNASITLAQSFCKFVEDAPPLYLSRAYIEAASRGLNGNEVCDTLGLGRPSPYYYALFAGHNIVVATLAYAQRWVPSLDRFIIQYFRNILHGVAYGENAHGSLPPFAFKYVPDPDRKIDEDPGLLKEGEKRKVRRTVEHIILGAFMVACTLGVLLIFGAVKLSRFLYAKYPLDIFYQK